MNLTTSHNLMLPGFDLPPVALAPPLAGLKLAWPQPVATPGLELIFCAGGNRKMARVAAACGYSYGFGTPGSSDPSLPVRFIDMMNWQAPDLDLHLAAVARHRPHIAVAPDLTDERDLTATLRYAAKLAKYAERVLIVPKLHAITARIPRDEGLMLGYSVPTRHGGSYLFPYEYGGWDVHILGGDPSAQMQVYLHLLAAGANVPTVDGNMTAKAATGGMSRGKACYWDDGEGRFVGLSSWQGTKSEGDTTYLTAFRLSCLNVQRAWAGLLAVTA